MSEGERDGMQVSGVAGVLIYVADPQAALDWYTRAFPQARRASVPWNEGKFEFLRIGAVQIELVPADAKGSSGPGGSIVYWRVDDFDVALAHLTGSGGGLYRGPMKIEDGMAMCQVRDPWGNCIGLRGPSRL